MWRKVKTFVRNRPCLLRLAAPFYIQPAQMWGTQAVTLRQLAEGAVAGKKTFNALEIGSWCGCSTVILGAVVRGHGRLVCVDWWRGEGDDHNAAASAHRDIFRVFWRLVSRAGLANVVVPMRGRSDVVLPMLMARQFDFIFIDGGHDYETVLHDIRQAKRLIKRGGMICGHDFSTLPCHAGVVQAVRQMFKSFEVEDDIWWKLQQ
ncbi:MAG: class I SAM-dependent methyltransferase [Acidobacteriota bacterium]|nr:class I SAM-dependent methyltransferase [Acidobacteriota bacterium]